MLYSVKGYQALMVPVAPDPSRVIWVSAGYKHPKYPHNYLHDGDDYEMDDGLSFDVVSPGDGLIMVAGMEPKIPNKDGLWGVVSINLNNLYHPLTGTICPDNFQAYHMYQLYVKPGQKIFQGDKIGRVLGRLEDSTNKYPGGHHVHVQGSYRMDLYRRSPQVAGGRYIKGTSVDSTVNLNTWLYLSPGQVMTVHPNTTCASAKDVITRGIA